MSVVDELSTAASAASLASTSCTAGKVIETKNYTSSKGFEFTVTTATCERSVDTRSLASVEEGPFDYFLAKRDLSECTDPEICICGDSCKPCSPGFYKSSRTFLFVRFLRFLFGFSRWDCVARRLH